jgi:inner membrane protein
MEIIVHAAAGLAVGTTAACAARNRKIGFFSLIAGFAGGVIPDIDALSLARPFDATIGAFLGLTHTGREIFFGTHPWSHRMALHSLTIPILFALLLFLRHIRKGPKSSVRRILPVVAPFFLGYCFHLLADMVTPGGPWRGIGLFWPLPERFGGWGLRWWFHNYDIFLVSLGCAISGMLAWFIPKHTIRAAAGIFFLSVALIVAINQAAGHSGVFNDSRKTYVQKRAEQDTLQRNALPAPLFRLSEMIEKSAEIFR